MTASPDPMPRVRNPDDRSGDMPGGGRGLFVGVADRHPVACMVGPAASGMMADTTHVGGRPHDVA